MGHGGKKKKKHGIPFWNLSTFWNSDTLPCQILLNVILYPNWNLSNSLRYLRFHTCYTKLLLMQTECFHTNSTPRDSQLLFSKTRSICHNIGLASSCPTTTSNRSFWAKISWKRYVFFFRNIRWNKVFNNSDFAEKVKTSFPLPNEVTTDRCAQYAA